MGETPDIVNEAEILMAKIKTIYAYNDKYPYEFIIDVLTVLKTEAIINYAYSKAPPEDFVSFFAYAEEKLKETSNLIAEILKSYKDNMSLPKRN